MRGGWVARRHLQLALQLRPLALLRPLRLHLVQLRPRLALLLVVVRVLERLAPLVQLLVRGELLALRIELLQALLDVPEGASRRIKRWRGGRKRSELGLWGGARVRRLLGKYVSISAILSQRDTVSVMMLRGAKSRFNHALEEQLQQASKQAHEQHASTRQQAAAGEGVGRVT